MLVLNFPNAIILKNVLKYYEDFLLDVLCNKITLIFFSLVSTEVIVIIGTSLLFNDLHKQFARNNVVAGSTEVFHLKHLY